MNTDPLHTLWNSAANRPDADAGQRLAAHFTSRLRRRRRFQAWWLAWTCCVLTGVSVLAIMQVSRQGIGIVISQWTLVPMLALPWLVVAHFVRAFFREGAGVKDAAQPLRATLLAAQASNATERRHLRIVGGLFAVMVPVTALAVWQLQVAGKSTVQQAWSMAFAFGLVFTLGAIGLAVKYRRYLAPEQRTIDARLNELDTPVAG